MPFITIMIFKALKIFPLFLITSCFLFKSTPEPGIIFIPLAHNTERIKIMEETTFILHLYNFTIEYSDPNRNQSAIQTHWRVSQALAIENSETLKVMVRDRAFLHISPRGKSSIYNPYQMVNATLEFEFEIRRDNLWEKTNPPRQYIEQYEAIVRDIRSRMLKYRYEF